MRGLTLRGAEGATCNVNSIAGPLAACGMACGGAILSARKRAMEPHGANERALAHGGFVGLRAVVHATLFRQ